MTDSTELLDLDDKRRLEFTLSTRETMIKTLLKDGVPTDEAEMSTLTSLLDGMDRTVLGKGRLKASEKSVSNDEQMKGIMSEMLKNLSFDAPKRDDVSSAPSLPSSVKIDDIVPGETKIGTDVLDYDSFINTMKREEK